MQGGGSGPLLLWGQRMRIAIGVARGLEYLHETKQPHGEIRSSNVLLFYGDVAKIANFGLLNLDPDSGPLLRSILGGPRTSGYEAPE